VLEEYGKINKLKEEVKKLKADLKETKFKYKTLVKAIIKGNQR